MDQIAADYAGEVTFVAVAGRSTLEASKEEAPRLFSDRLLWGYDDSLWRLYEVFGQPTAFLITGDDRLYQGPWYRISDEAEIRRGLDALVILGKGPGG